MNQSVAGSKYADIDRLANVMALIEQHYVEEVDTHELLEGAIEGMLGTLDPHTSYMSPDLFKEMQLDTRGEFEGLGIEITKQRDGYVTIVAPIDGTPAAAAKLRARDQIVAVCPEIENEESCELTQELSLLEAVKLMRGKRGSTVMLKVLRQGWAEPNDFVIQRGRIEVSSVRMQMIEPGLPYIRLSQFQERTAEDLQDALEEATDQGPLQGLVLDLRNNPGGLLDQAVKVADVFLEEGLIVYSEGRGGGSRMEWSASASNTQPEYPIFVLVNEGSASASEIVAGALQDHRRGVVLGEETFGKGSVQTIIPLENESGLRLTTALYYLPTGRSIQEVRIQPDVKIGIYTTEEVEALESEEETERFGEEDLSGHIKNKGDNQTADAKKEEFERRLKIDKQLKEAIHLLKTHRILSDLSMKQAG
jgi:carboxyl-terminal processing protease